MKPYVICHMNTSVGGRILGSQWRTAGNRMAGLFERLHEQLGGGSWLIGRVTGSEYAKAEAYPGDTDQTYPRQPWFARRDAAAYGMALDAQGKIAWGTIRHRRRPDSRGADGAGVRRAFGGAPPRWRLLYLRRRARA